MAKKKQHKKSPSRAIVPTKKAAVSKLPELSISEKVEQVMIQGDLTPLTPDQRVEYYKAVCKSVGFNPLTTPFQYIFFKEPSGREKLQLYATKAATEQLRQMHGVSVVASRKEITQHEDANYYCSYEVDVRDRTGRIDSAAGIVPLFKFKDGQRLQLSGVEWANAVMKCHTKAKRRATLSICGLAFLDESELDTMKIVGGVTPEGRIYRFEEDPDNPPPNTHAAAQQVAQDKIKKLAGGIPSDTSKESASEPPIEKKSAPARPAGRLELDWSQDEASPILRGDLEQIFASKGGPAVIVQLLEGRWCPDQWWHISPRKAEVLRDLCRELQYELVEIMPKTSAGKPAMVPAEPQRESGEGSSPAKPSPAVVSGLIEQITEKMTAGKKAQPEKGIKGRPAVPYLSVLIKDDQKKSQWYSCFDKELFKWLIKGKSGEFLVQKFGEYLNLVGIQKLGNMDFHENVPVVQKDREPGSAGLFNSHGWHQG